MNDILLQRFIQLISNNTGLHIREQDKASLSQKIYARMKLLKLSVPDQYYQLLESENDKNSCHLETRGASEWRELTLLLTTGETFFFRDQGQIALLKNRILSQLIEQKKKARYAGGEAKPSLRIWSAGCSTGEEVYSLAILVKELIPDWHEWNILILGTDINPESIAKAQRGIYDSWSFRMVNPELQRQYFSQRKTSWEVDEQIRRMVTFRSGNLIKEYFPSFTSGIHSMDVILCRNVFIYFDSKAISVVLEKFHNTLRQGGYLVTGHAELHGQNLGQLQAKVFPESVVYQRSEDLQVETPLTGKGVRVQGSGVREEVDLTPKKGHKPLYLSRHKKKDLCGDTQCDTQSIGIKSPGFIYGDSLTPDPRSLTPLKETTSQTGLSQAETLFQNGAYAIAIKEAEQVIKQHPDNFEAYYLIAQAFANLGECEQASHWCQQALKVDSLSVKPYYLLAHIAEEQGNVEQAKELFKKVIYLAPSFIPAYLELGSVYEREGDKTRARKMRNTALEILKGLPPHATLEHQGEMTAGELVLHVKKLLRTHP